MLSYVVDLKVLDYEIRNEREVRNTWIKRKEIKKITFFNYRACNRGTARVSATAAVTTQFCIVVVLSMYQKVYTIHTCVKAVSIIILSICWKSTTIAFKLTCWLWLIADSAAANFSAELGHVVVSQTMVGKEKENQRETWNKLSWLGAGWMYHAWTISTIAWRMSINIVRISWWSADKTSAVVLHLLILSAHVYRWFHGIPWANKRRDLSAFDKGNYATFPFPSAQVLSTVLNSHEYIVLITRTHSACEERKKNLKKACRWILPPNSFAQFLPRARLLPSWVTGAVQRVISRVLTQRFLSYQPRTVYKVEYRNCRHPIVGWLGLAQQQRENLQTQMRRHPSATGDDQPQSG